MSKPAETFRALKTRLQADTTLAGYVKQFLEGQREASSITQYPTVITDYTGSSESDDAYGEQRIRMRCVVYMVITVTDKDKQIVGDSTTKGALDYLNDLKTAIDTDRTLGGKAIHTSILDDSFSTVDFPVRVLALNVEILIEQKEAVRT